ncbi:MAG: glycosyltransferase [Alphaproteobacteria bacterium]|nr:glycosyltransferase [Alphaproteobacteria bacterium]
MHSYHYAHGLAQRGHEVHVVTNAAEVRPPFRALMRDEDWTRCDADYGDGHVQVHWTDPLDRHQFTIPKSNHDVTKLASLAIDVARTHDAVVIFSYYLTPYGVAGHLAAQAVGRPHVVRTAGSDAGRLWDHPQFKPLYDSVFLAADTVSAGPKTARRLIEVGVSPERIRPDGDLVVPDPAFEGPASPLDLDAIRSLANVAAADVPSLFGEMPPDMPAIGVYGKLGERKGTFALLDALGRIRDAGRQVGLLVMGHGRPRVEDAFRQKVSDLDLADRVLQIPFLPNWRVPEFIARCSAVCVLEQDFPIAIHMPIVAREVLTAGGCLVASTEMLAKLPDPYRLVHGYNCCAVSDANNSEELAARLLDVIDDPEGTAAVARRGRDYAISVHAASRFPETIEDVLQEAAMGQPRAGPRSADRSVPMSSEADDFPATRAIYATLSQDQRRALNVIPPPADGAEEWAAQIEVALANNRADGDYDDAWLIEVVRLERMLATTRISPASGGCERATGLVASHRLEGRRWAMDDADWGIAKPYRWAEIPMQRFTYDANEVMLAVLSGHIPQSMVKRDSTVALLADPNDGTVRGLVLDRIGEAILTLSDGTRDLSDLFARLGDAKNGVSADEVAGRVQALFELGLLGLTFGGHRLGE